MGENVGRTLRSTNSVVTFAAMAAITAFLFGDAALRGAWHLVARWLPLAVFVLWVLWVVLCRSSVRVSSDHLTVTNMLRSHRVPWARVTEITYRPQLSLALDTGSSLPCWGGPSAGRAGLRSAGRTDPERMMIDGAWMSAPSSSDSVRTQWDLPAIALGGLLLVIALTAASVVRQ